MYCLKCGKETGSERVFCANCLESMEKYPVKPGTHISLPRRETPIASKKTVRRHRTVTPEEQIRHQKRIIRVLSLCLVTVSVLLALCAFRLFYPAIEDYTDNSSRMGSNYTVIPANTR